MVGQGLTLSGPLAPTQAPDPRGPKLQVRGYRSKRRDSLSPGSPSLFAVAQPISPSAVTKCGSPINEPLPAPPPPRRRKKKKALPARNAAEQREAFVKGLGTIAAVTRFDYPKRFIVRDRGAHLRKGGSLQSEKVCSFEGGQRVLVDKTWPLDAQTLRAHVVEPRIGWVSLKCLADGRTQHFRRADDSSTGRGAAAAATWIVRGDESRRRRGLDVDSPRRRVAAPPRSRRG